MNTPNSPWAAPIKDLIKKDATKSVPIQQAMEVNFGMRFGQLPIEALDLLGIACDRVDGTGSILDESCSTYQNAEVYARVDAVGLSSTNIHVLKLFGGTLHLMCPDGVGLEDLSAHPLMSRTDSGIEEFTSRSSPMTVYRALAKLQLPEENDRLFDKESLYPHTHYVKEVVIGAIFNPSGRIDPEQLLNVAQHQEVKKWKVLWCHMRLRDEVKAAFFAKKVSGPTCENGHPMFHMTLKEVAWSKTLACKTCNQPTTYALQTCKRRCEIFGICKDCEDHLARTIKKVAAQQRRKDFAEKSSSRRGAHISEGLPNFSDEDAERIVFLRFRLQCNITEEEYKRDPFLFDGKLIHEISRFLGVDPRRIVMIDVMEGIVFDVALVHAGFQLTPTRHRRKWEELPFVEMPMVDMFRNLSSIVKQRLDPVDYPILSNTPFVDFDNDTGVVIMCEPDADLQVMLAPSSDICEPRELICQQCLCGPILDHKVEYHLTDDCVKRIVSCELECGARLVYEDLKQHLLNQCPERIVICTCKKVVVAKDMDEHLLNCEQNSWTCPECKVETVTANKKKHQAAECEFRRVLCIWCGSDKNWNTLAQHKSSECPQRVSKAIELKKACWQLNYDEAARLLDSGADPNTSCPVAAAGGQPDDSALGNCLHALAAVQAPYAFGILLLEFAADVHLRDHNGCQPLHVAAQHDAAELCHALLEYKADTTVEDYDGRTPLFLASFHQRRNSIALLEHGVVGKTPQQVRRGIMMHRDIEAVKRVVAYEQRMQPIRDSVKT